MHLAVGLIKQTFSDWLEDKAPRLGAALAYYAIFSIPPLLMLTIAVVGFFYQGDVTESIHQQMVRLMGNEAGRSLMETLQGRESNGVLSVMGIALLIFGASGVFGQLQDALNTIWEVQPKPGRGIAGIIRDRFLSFTMILGVAFLLLTSLVLTAVMAAMSNALGAWLPGKALAHILELVFSFALTTLLFAMIYKILPDVKIAWSDVWIGAAATAALFTLGKFALGLYLGNVGSEFGAAGSVITMIVWVYYSAQILFLGAEFTQVYANQYGSRVEPADNAESVSEEKREEEGRPEKQEPSPVGSDRGEAAVRRVATVRPGVGIGIAMLFAFMMGLGARDSVTRSEGTDKAA